MQAAIVGKKAAIASLAGKYAIYSRVYKGYRRILT